MTPIQPLSPDTCFRTSILADQLRVHISPDRNDGTSKALLVRSQQKRLSTSLIGFGSLAGIPLGCSRRFRGGLLQLLGPPLNDRLGLFDVPLALVLPVSDVSNQQDASGTQNAQGNLRRVFHGSLPVCRWSI